MDKRLLVSPDYNPCDISNSTSVLFCIFQTIRHQPLGPEVHQPTGSIDTSVVNNNKPYGSVSIFMIEKFTSHEKYPHSKYNKGAG